MTTDLMETRPAPIGAFMAFADLTESQFEYELVRTAVALKRIERVKLELMTPDVDYGIIPGTGKKPTLLLPGAQRLCRIAGLVATFVHVRTTGDGIGAPPIAYEFVCRLHVGSAEGPVVGEGIGTCNAWEKKYRYRKGERLCPKCSQPTVRRSKFPVRGAPEGTPKGWWCANEACKEQFEFEDIEDQGTRDIENPDLYDLDNTLAKMGKKRSFIDATLITTMSSGLFTQDIGDDDGVADDHVRAALLAKFTALLKEHSISKNADLMVLTMQCLSRSLTYPQVAKLPLIELRVLEVKAREFLGEHVGDVAADSFPSEAVVVDDGGGESPEPDATQFGSPITKMGA